VEQLFQFSKTIDSTMCHTNYILDDAYPPTDVPAKTTETTESASNVVVIGECVGKLIRDLGHSDSARVHTALYLLSRDIVKHKEKFGHDVTVWGGCAALVHLLKNCLKRAMKKVPACCDQVTNVNEIRELATMENTLHVITNLTWCSEMGRGCIASVGGVETAVKVMKIFPKCQRLQECACGALLNLSGCNIGKAKAIEAGGIETILAAVTTHLNSAKPLT
jgi:hypothetical protein